MQRPIPDKSQDPGIKIKTYDGYLLVILMVTLAAISFALGVIYARTNPEISNSHQEAP